MDQKKAAELGSAGGCLWSSRQKGAKMEKLKPCPFCGNPMNGYPDYTIRFKLDKKKIFGVYHEICVLHCTKCTCTIQQAGATREEAEKHTITLWNRRMERSEE